jgi:hypothetical protein
MPTSRSRRHRGRLATALVAALVLVVIALAALPAAAGTGPRDRGDRGDRNRRIAVGDIVVSPGEVVDGPLIGIDGDTTISGTVDGAAFVVRGDLVLNAGGEIDGDVLVVRGDARISGTVDGDVTVLKGRAVIRGGATVDGDVRSSRDPQVARGARVTGEVEGIDLPGLLGAIGTGLLVFWWIAVTISTAVLGALLLALFPRGFESGASVGRDPKRWWIAALVGIGLVIGLPIVVVVAISSLIGLPFGLGLLGALGLVHAVGYVAGAFFLGRCILKSPKNRFGAFFIGWAILRLVALLPGIGMLGWGAAATFGIGTLAVAGFRAGQGPRQHTDSPTAAPDVAPPTDAPDLETTTP